MIFVLGCQASAEVSSSTLILVNKENALPSNYTPDDLVTCDVPFAPGVIESRKLMRREAAEALAAMFEAASKDGFELLGISGFRSYQTQRELYQAGLERNGLEHVTMYVAQAGRSEHQTGLAMDLGIEGYTDLTEDFAETDAYVWLTKHAHEYGFIIRYTKKGVRETGYAFEPWHMRYLGVETATDVWKSGLTLEAWYRQQLKGTTLKAQYAFLSTQVDS
ncbi:MAG: M15 family metallopeptidase [Clostridia bacterium]|nr:M15 family metallopeptidase [Clostridia bacterium]